MRILIVNTYYFPEIMGGAEYSVKKLAEGLQQEGQTVRVLCTGNQYTKETVDGIEVVRIVPHNVSRAINIDKCNKIQKLIHRVEDIWNIKNRIDIAKEIDSFNPDVIHTNGLYDFTPIVWMIAKKKNIRVVHTIRDYYLMCPRVSLTCKKREKCDQPLIYCRIHRLINRRSSKNVDFVTAPSELTLNTLIGDGFFKFAQSKPIPNAIDYSEEALNRCLANRQRKDRTICSFVYLGTLSEQKGILWLVESFKKINNDNVRLYIAGKGPLEEYIRDVTYSDKRILYVGFLNEKEMNHMLDSMDVMVCPSLWQEPFGRVVLDAYKNAMPIIVSNRGALPELVINRETGIVVSPEDKESLSNAISYFCEHKSEYMNFSKQAAAKIKDFSLSKQVLEFLSCYVC